jgi:hypothetical protein
LKVLDQFPPLGRDYGKELCRRRKRKDRDWFRGISRTHCTSSPIEDFVQYSVTVCPDLDQGFSHVNRLLLTVSLRKTEKGTGCRKQIREVVTIKVTMIALASFIVEPDYTLPVLTVKQSVLEEMGTAGNWLRHLPNNDLDDRSVGQHSLGTFDKDRCNHLIMRLSNGVGNKANAI